MAGQAAEALFIRTLELFLASERSASLLVLDYHQAAEWAEVDVHEPVRVACQEFASVEVITDENVDSSCVYVLTMSSGRVATVFLSTLLPYAAVVSTGDGPARLLDAQEVRDESSDLMDVIDRAGLKIVEPTTCQLLTRFVDPVSRTQRTVFEVLFERDVDPPWKWSLSQSL